MLHILKCTVMIWVSKSMWNTDQAHKKGKINSHSLLINHIQHFPFQHTIGIEHRTVIWLYLDKYACPVLHFAGNPVLQLDKSGVYLKKAKGKNTNPKYTKSALQWKVLINHKVLFLKAAEEGLYSLIPTSFP